MEKIHILILLLGYLYQQYKKVKVNEVVCKSTKNAVGKYVSGNFEFTVWSSLPFTSHEPVQNSIALKTAQGIPL